MKKLILSLLCTALLVGCSSQIQNDPTQTNGTTGFPTTSTDELVPDPTIIDPTIATILPETLPPKDSLSIDNGAYLMHYEEQNTGNYLDYYLFVPNNATVDMPLVVFLHGIYEVGQPELLKNFGIVNCVKDIYGEDFPFLLLLPSTHIQSWTLYDVPYTLFGLIDSVADTYETDRDHIIITGHSLGAIGTWKMVNLYGNYFSAAVPVSCGFNESIDYNNFLDVAVWGFVGNSGEDEKNYSNAMHSIASGIRDAGGSVELTVLDGAGHRDTATLPYTPELFDWMISQ